MIAQFATGGSSSGAAFPPPLLFAFGFFPPSKRLQLGRPGALMSFAPKLLATFAPQNCGTVQEVRGELPEQGPNCLHPAKLGPERPVPTKCELWPPRTSSGAWHRAPQRESKPCGSFGGNAEASNDARPKLAC